MPALEAVPAAVDPIVELGDELAAMPSGELNALLSSLSDEQLEVAEYALAQVVSVGWRATPATMALHLEPEQFEPWRYFLLLGESFRDASEGVDPHQLWMLPSQYGKTTLLWLGAIWLLERDPTLRIMYVSYDATKAVSEGGKARDFAERHMDELTFRIRRDRRASSWWQTTEGGGLYSTGVNGAITGFPQDVLLLDDLIKGWQDAHSEAIRKRTWNVYISQIRMRIQSSKQPIILAGTRWHEDDPQARLLAKADEPNADQWKIIRLPAIAEAPQPDNPDPLLRQPDPLGREPGEVLEPERFPLEEVLARRVGLGSYLWSAMEQQRPSPEEGDEIRREWWQWYTSRPPKFDDTCTSWDLKLKDKSDSGDYVAGQAWGRTGSDFWFLEALRGQWNQVETKTAIVLMKVRHPRIAKHYIEAAASAPEVIEQLRAPQPKYKVSDETAGKLGMTLLERKRCNGVFRRGMTGLIAVPPKGDKITRMRAYTGLIEAKNVHLPESGGVASGAHQLVNECAAFPNPAHDDSIDAFSQAMKKLARGVQSVGGAPARRPEKPKPAARATKNAGGIKRVGRPTTRGTPTRAGPRGVVQLRPRPR